MSNLTKQCYVYIVYIGLLYIEITKTLFFNHHAKKINIKLHNILKLFTLLHTLNYDFLMLYTDKIKFIDILLVEFMTDFVIIDYY